MPPLPDPEEILEYVRRFEEKGQGAPARRDIAKHFRAKGPERAALRSLLSQMEDQGLIELEGRKARAKDGLPKVCVMDVTGTDAEGDLLATPIKWDGEALPHIILTPKNSAKTNPPLGRGDRFLGRLHPRGGGFEAEPIKRLGTAMERVLGVYVRTGRGGGMVEPVSRKAGKPLDIAKGDENGAKDGALVFAEPLPQRGYGPRRARIAEVIGDFADSANWSLIALANQDIRTEFPAAALDEAEAAVLPAPGQHEDIRHVPLVTIDPADAKDHDDAVYAERLEDGFKVLVAIADVSWFVRPGSALDKEARLRGNSVYLVDRVVPMLPEALSNGLCSLHEGEDRTALVCEMIFSEDGRKRKHRFFRALMRSAASLSYEEAQAAAEGRPSARARPLKKDVIDPLFDAYRAMLQARAERSPLDLELPERKIILNDDGAVDRVELKARFDAHKLIEAMMVAANVCAAETLERRRRACIFRIHDAPDPERVEALRGYLENLGYSLPRGQVMKPQNFNRILAKAAERDEIEMVSMAILRSQSQAAYHTENIGHFGLNLMRYAHFTSPIRRYADLTVHRGLVAALGLGPGAERGVEAQDLQKTAEAISDLERKAIAAERETQDRFLAAFLEDRLGAEFEGRVNGVTRAGLFVTLDETGADGFVPARTLGWERFEHDEKANALIGERSGGRYRMGQRVRVALVEVTPLQGGLRFDMLSEPEEGEAPKNGPTRGRRGRTDKRPAKRRREDTVEAGEARPATATRSGNPRQRDEPPAETPRRAKSAAGEDAGAPSQLERRPRKTGKQKPGARKTGSPKTGSPKAAAKKAGPQKARAKKPGGGKTGPAGRGGKKDK